MAITIGILKVGDPPDALVAEFGDYPSMITALLLQVRNDLSFRVFHVLDGEFPESPRDCDAWIISGSRYSITSDLPWMRQLQLFIRSAALHRTKMVGICFGHQIMAVALGGEVQRSEIGWVVGHQAYQLCDSQGKSNSVALCAFHEDQVVRIPPNSRVLGRSPKCPYAMLEYGEFGFSLQAHPEFSNDFTSALISHRLREKVAPDVVSQSLQGLQQATDPTCIAELIVNRLS